MARRFAVTRRSSISLSIAAVAFCLAVHATPLWSAGSASGAGQTQPVVGPSVFRVAPAVAVTGLPVAIVAGDLNNDGKVDLVIGSTSTGTVDILLGDGKGNFQAPVRYKVGGAPVALALGDFRGHGKIDIAVANQSANSINILLGKGDGTFEAAATYGVGSSPTALAVGDLYGDGRSDLLVANTGSATLSVLRSNGDGTFQNAKFYSVGASARAIAVGDFNGDGKLDIAAGNADGTVTILLNDGAGRLNGVSRLNATANVVSGLTTGDLNHDGKSDLAVVDSVANTVSVLLGNGDGTFQPSSVLSVGNQPASIALADVNGDAIPDLLVANKSGNTVSVMLGVGDGSFHASTEYVVGNSPASIVIADFNGDGHLDFATANSADGTVSTPLGNGDGTFTAAQDYRTHLERKSAAVGDLDGDGHPDLVVASFCGSDLKCTGNGTASVFLSDRKGGLKAGSIYSLGRGPVSIALADVNGDKKLDLIAVNRDENSAMVLLGNGDGTFQEGVAYPAGVSPVAVGVGDFNKDGKVDLAIVSLCGSAGCNQQGSISFILGNGDGSFKAGASYDVGFSPTSLAMGDLTGGGKLDVVVANACGKSSACSNSTATVLIGDGKGSFSLKGDLDLGRSVSSIALVDLKGHGKLDLVAANSADNKIGVLLGNGDGTFNRQVPYTVGNGPSAAIVADFNGDGRPDVAVANLKDSTVSLLAGNGDGTLQTAEVYPVGFGPDALVALDLDGSGRLAIVTANGNSGGSPAGNDITVLANAGAAPALTGTATAVVSSLNPSTYGQLVTFTATVTPTPDGGTVNFTSGSTALCSGVPVSTITGKAACAYSTLPAGSDPVTAVYSGDTNFGGSTGNLSPNQTVNKADTTTAVTSSLNPSVFGQSVTFTATVSPVAPGAGTPTGTVTFLDGGSAIGTGTLSGGVATFTTSALAAGSHTITTTYGGDANFNGSTGSLTGNPQVVKKANTTTAVSSNHNPSVFGQPVTFTATVSPVPPGGMPTGTVTFLDGGVAIGTGTLSGGVATFTTPALAVGNHTITTTYPGDGNFNGSTGSLTGNPQVVKKANTTTAVTSSQNPSVFGQLVTFTATVSPVSPGAGTPTGTVTFLDGVSAIGTGILSGGVATFSTSALAVGSHTITTTYPGDGNFNGSTGSLTGNPQVVNKAATTTAISLSPASPIYGQAITFTATVTAVPPGAGTPTGSVQFNINGQNTTVPLTNGSASIATPTCLPGPAFGVTWSITASYSGDSNFTASSKGPLTSLVSQATTGTNALNTNPTPVFFTQMGDSVLPQIASFQAQASDTEPAPIPMCLLPVGENIQFSDPLGGSAPFPINNMGIATYTSSALKAGHHPFTANYVGDANFSVSAPSGTIHQDVWNFSSTSTALAYNVPAGYVLTVPLPVTSIGGLQGTINTMCSAVPAGAACTPDQRPITADNSVTTMSMVATLGRSAPGIGPLTLPAPYSYQPSFTATPDTTIAHPSGTLTLSLPTPVAPLITPTDNPLPTCTTPTGQNAAPSLAVNVDLSLTAMFTCDAKVPTVSSITVTPQTDTAQYDIDWGNGGVVPLGAADPTVPETPKSSQPFTLGTSYTVLVKTLDVANGINVISVAYNPNPSPPPTQAGIATSFTSATGTVFGPDGVAPFTGTIAPDGCVIADGTLAGKPASDFSIKCSYDPPQFPLNGSTVKVTINTNVAAGAGPQSRLTASLWLGLSGGVFMGFCGFWTQGRKYSKRRLALRLIAAIGIALLALSVACGGGFNNPIKGNGLTPPGPYTIVINGKDSTTGQIRTVTAVQLVVTAD